MDNTDESKEPNKGQRVAKVMARAGLCSRRVAETWVAEGRVKVNGDYITTPATLIKDGDELIVDDKIVQGAEKTRLFIFNKPAGYLTTNKDPKGRDTMFDLLPDDIPRVVTVGRLDMNTEGLILLTNDGELARYLELPKNKIERTYRVRAHGRVTQDRLDKLKLGMVVDKVRYQIKEAKLDKTQGANNWIEITLEEGKNREVRKVMEAIGLSVNRLIRVSYGPFHLGKLPNKALLEIKTSKLKSLLPEYFDA